MSNNETSNRVEAARAGNRAAFAELLRSHQQFAYGVAFRFLWDVQEAEDVVQETFVRIWRNLPRFDAEQSFTTWMYAIVTNLCRDRVRDRKRRPSIAMEPDCMAQLEDDGIQDVATAVAGENLLEIIRRLTEGLPLKQRLVYTLRDLQDLSVQEVAGILEISESSVKTNLHLARRKLRGLLVQEYRITGVTS